MNENDYGFLALLAKEENEDVSKTVRELVSEYVCNPVSADSVRYKPVDGMDWYSIISDFNAIWDLTISTPPQVHDSIISKYPYTI